jgi:hypothetical protein
LYGLEIFKTQEYQGGLDSKIKIVPDERVKEGFMVGIAAVPSLLLTVLTDVTQK